MRIAVRVRPGARADVVGGRWTGSRGPALVVAVRARPVDGAANAAVSAVLGTAFGVRPSAVLVVAGARSRDKLVELTGDEPAIRARLAELLR